VRCIRWGFNFILYFVCVFCFGKNLFMLHAPVSVCVCVCVCVVYPYAHAFTSKSWMLGTCLYHALPYCLRQVPSLKGKLTDSSSELSSSLWSTCLCIPNPGEAQPHPALHWVLEIRNQVLTLVQHAVLLCEPSSYLLRFLFNICPGGWRDGSVLNLMS
jgi:hypothetical protein